MRSLEGALGRLDGGGEGALRAEEVALDEADATARAFEGAVAEREADPRLRGGSYSMARSTRRGWIGKLVDAELVVEAGAEGVGSGCRGWRDRRGGR